MSVYNIDDINRMYTTATSEERQIQLLYQMVLQLKATVQDVNCRVTSYPGYQSQVALNKKEIDSIKGTQNQIKDTLNQLIKALKCRFDNIDQRLSALEGKKTSDVLGEI